MSRIVARIPVVLYQLSWLVAVFLVGYVVAVRGIWPNSVIAGGLDAAYDLSTNVEAYLGVSPTRHLFADSHLGKGLTVYKPAQMQPGVIFVTGFFDRKHVMKVLAPDGTEFHRWEVAFGKTFENADHILPATDRPLNEWLTHIHGAYPFKDGSVVFNFDQHGLVRVNACGKVVWKIGRMTNHSVSMADDGTLWVPARVYHEHESARFPLHHAPFFEDQLLQVSQDGTILREISLPELLYKNDLYSVVFPTGYQDIGNFYADFMHTNDADVLTRQIAPAFPMFKAGDIVVSMRQLNLIFVFDPQTGTVKWHQTGPWLRQHDPDFLKDGTISVFNNRSDDTLFGRILGGSRITRIDPATRKSWVAYAQPDGKEKRRFFTNIMGKHQTLDNGNILITEALGGRIFEVTPAGEIVWEYVNRFDKKRVALVTGAIRLPHDYFHFNPNACETRGPSS